MQVTSKLKEFDMNEYLTVSELARRWRCSKAKVYRVIKSESMPYLNFGSRRLFPSRCVLKVEEGWMVGQKSI